MATRPTLQELTFGLTGCILGNLDIDIPTDHYGSLKAIIQNTDNEALSQAIKKVDPHYSAEVAATIKGIINGEIKDWEVKRLISDNNPSNQALILKYKDEAQVCFPGTIPSDPSMLKADANALPARFKIHGTTESETEGEKPCRVHKGFLRWAGDIQDKVAVELKNPEPPPGINKFKFWGYSLGSSTATLCALGLDEDLTSKLQAVCRFAPPNLGNGPFGEAVKQKLQDESGPAGKVFNIINFEDPVTLVPLWFKRVPGDTIEINGNGADASSNTPSRTPTALQAARHLIGSVNVDHHLPHSYFRGIAQLPDESWRELELLGALPQARAGQTLPPSLEQLPGMDSIICELTPSHPVAATIGPEELDQHFSSSGPAADRSPHARRP